MVHTKQITENIFFPTVEIKDYVMTDGRTFFNQPVKNDGITYGKVTKIVTGQRDDYTTGCLLDCNSFK